MRSKTLAAALLLTACAPPHEPVVDAQGVDPAQHRRDLAACRQLADRVSPAARAAGGAVVGTLGGAAVGAAVGLFTGDLAAPLDGAVVGGGAGLALGADSGLRARQAIVEDCLRRRGYAVAR